MQGGEIRQEGSPAPGPPRTKKTVTLLWSNADEVVDVDRVAADSQVAEWSVWAILSTIAGMGGGRMEWTDELKDPYDVEGQGDGRAGVAGRRLDGELICT